MNETNCMLSFFKNGPLSLSFHKVSKFLRFNIFLPLSFPFLFQRYSVPTAIFCAQKQRNNVSTNCTGFFPRDNSLPSISYFFVPTHFCFSYLCLSFCLCCSINSIRACVSYNYMVSRYFQQIVGRQIV